MTERPRVTFTSPAEAIQLVPHILGFIPEESLVISVFQDHRLTVTARTDLADVWRPGAVEDLLDRIWARFPDAYGHLWVFTADRESGWNLLGRCQTHLPRAAAQLAVVDGDTWHLPDGQSGTVDRNGPIATEAIYHGMSVRSSRAELEQMFASAPLTLALDRQAASVQATLPAAGDTAAAVSYARGLIAQNLPRAAGARTAITTEDALRLALLVQRADARDAALLSMDLDNADQHLKLWSQVVQRVPERVAEMPLYLAGMAAWIAGEGAVTCIAADRSLAAAGQREGARAATLLKDLTHSVVPPTAWPSIRADIARAHASAPRNQTAARWESVTSKPHIADHRPGQGQGVPRAFGPSI
jgi:hypothetical protein